MTRLFLMLGLALTACTTANAIDICEAKCTAGEVAVVRNVPQARTKTSTVTRWEEQNGRQIPVTEQVEQVFTEFIPVVDKKPIGFYRVSDINGKDVGEEQVRTALAAKTLVVLAAEEIPPAKRAVFKPGTLFLQAKDTPQE